MSGTGSPSRSRRREEILSVASTLFAQNGYIDVGMDEIGDAVGIGGPGIYRYFTSKEDIFETIVRRRADVLLDGARDVFDQAATADEALRGLIHQFVAATSATSSIAHTATYERHSLSPRVRGLMERMERLVAANWISALSAARPNLSEGELVVRVRAAFALGLTLGRFRIGLDPAERASFTERMILTALLDESAYRARRS